MLASDGPDMQFCQLTKPYVYLLFQVCAVMDFQSQQACTAAAMLSRGGAPCCAAGYQGGCLRLFDLVTASLLWSYDGPSPTQSIMALEPSCDGKQLLAVAR